MPDRANKRTNKGQDSVGIQSWKPNLAPKKERDREEEGTEQSVPKTGIVQQQW